MLSHIRYIALVASLSAAAGAQPVFQGMPRTPPAPRPAHELIDLPAEGGVPVDPAVILADVRGAYREGTFAERITLTVDAPGQSRRESAVIRIHRAEEALLELGPLRIWCEREGVGSEIYIAHAADPHRFFEFEAPALSLPSALAHALPPIALPQIALAFGDDASLPDPTPLTTGIVWESASLFPDAAPPVAILTGAGPDSSVTLIIDGATSRLRRAILLAPRALQIVLDIEPIDPGAPAAWRIDTRARQRVSDITDLAPAHRPFRVGAAAPDLEFLARDDQVWRLRDYRGKPVLLTIFRSATPDAATGKSGAEQAAHLLDPADKTLILVRHVALLDVSAAGARDRLGQLVSGWGPDLLWSADGPGSMDRFSPGATSVALAIDSAGFVRAVIPLDGRASEGYDIALELASALAGKPLAK